MNNLEIDSIVENVKSSLSKLNNNKLVDVTNSFFYFITKIIRLYTKSRQRCFGTFIEECTL